MCGIVGYIGKRDTLPVLIEGLKRLEYRGYDSAGIAYRDGKGIEIFKTKGKIRDLETILPSPLPRAGMGLGHTRWATHGAPSSRNAHPHIAEGVAVVHNGIIENYREIKSGLLAEGHRFSSDTDTEVIPQLVSKYLREGLDTAEAIRRSVKRLSGSYAVGIMSDRHPNALFAVRRGSPLVIGLGEGEFFFASDIPAVLPYTRKFIFMEDGQLCILTESDIRLEYLDRSRGVAASRVVDIDWEPSMAEKSGYGSFMLKEIHEQPDILEAAFGSGGATSLPKDMMAKTARLQMAACGTSYHAALVGRYFIEEIARIPVDVEIASEYRYKNPIIEKGTLFISITQSGETADTLAAQREAKRRGAVTLTICNVMGSTATREADHVIYTKAGPEIGVASTKAFTAQLAVFYLLALEFGVRKGALTQERADALASKLEEIPGLIRAVLAGWTEIDALARSLSDAKGVLYLGRGINYPIALEGALKLKEISYIHAEGYAAGEMKHGPIALIDEGSPVVVIAPFDDLFGKMLSNVEEVKARGGRVIAVTDRPDLLAGKADGIVEVPGTYPKLSPFVNVIPLQLLACFVAAVRGCDVDQPRNLAKSVTVE